MTPQHSLRDAGFGNGRRRAALSVILAIISCVALGNGARAEDVDEMARKLTAMRAEVESLADELDLSQQRLRNELDSLAQQKADLEIQIDREQIRLREVQAAIERQKKSATGLSESGAELVEPLRGDIAAVRAYVKSGLPFRAPERLAELDRIEEDLTSGRIRPERAASMLWAFVEDEFRLTADSGLDQQVVSLGGEDQLAQVARLGMVMLLFKTNDGRFGHAVKSGDTWTYEEFAAGADAGRAAELFDAFEKNIRVGYFEVPGVPAKREVSR
ncbi:MAG: DUF3450 family protein [Deltaproteobacteria bacterium]|nr:DUF3450 family protein [Deltaproteobacteria bacterium]MCB9488716.1 DUF3450 family protein [Deltaproteobacteria bacterium]